MFRFGPEDSVLAPEKILSFALQQNFLLDQKQEDDEPVDIGDIANHLTLDKQPKYILCRNCDHNSLYLSEI